MIFDAVLNVVFLIFKIILSPIDVINFAVDFVSSVPVVAGFINVIAYLLPWKNLIPIFTFVIGITIFKITISIIKTLWDLLPIV